MLILTDGNLLQISFTTVDGSFITLWRKFAKKVFCLHMTDLSSFHMPGIIYIYKTVLLPFYGQFSGICAGFFFFFG